jgi:aspartyl/asparaginyl-tRNA synthetase
MERTLTGELRSRVGERVRLAGWLHHQRRLARLTFVLLRDRAGLAQVVVDDPAAVDEVAGWLPETVLEVEATVVANERAPGGFELHDPAFVVVSEPAELPPIELRRPELKESLPTILDHAPVSLRHPKRREAFRLAAASVRGFRAALDRLGFVEIQSPKVVVSATETGSNLFTVDWFGRQAFLAQSPQFYKQTMVGVFERVYEVGPVFRRAARHVPPPGRVRLARCRDRVHPRPLRRDARAPRGDRRHVRSTARQASKHPRCLPRFPGCTSLTPASTTWISLRPTSAGSARSTAPSSCS